MTKHRPQNERIKREYFIYLKEAKRQSEATVDAVAMALNRFETWNRHRDFKAFHHQQAVAFKAWLAGQQNPATGAPLSKATLHGTMSHLRRFYQWLAGQPGYKSRLKYSDADYFSISDGDARIATARRQRPVPTLEQLHHVLATMPARTDIERRNRALVAFALLTGARDSAIASAKLKHVDLIVGSFHQDAREVRTKFSKTFTSLFFPVGEEPRLIVAEWVDYLRRDRLFGNDDPLFPKPLTSIGPDGGFRHEDLSRDHWADSSPIRAVFRQAFEAAGLPYYNPHSLRHLLAMLGEQRCRNAEEFKAWSQNLGHEGVLTTFMSYGTVSPSRQREIFAGLQEVGLGGQRNAEAASLLRGLIRLMPELNLESDSCR